MIEAVLSPEAIDRIVAATGKEPDDRERLAESIAETIHDYFANRGKFRLFAPDRIVDRALKQARKLQKLATEYYEIKDLIVVWINEENLRRRKTHAKVKRPERLWSHKEILTGWHLPLIAGTRQGRRKDRQGTGHQFHYGGCQGRGISCTSGTVSRAITRVKEEREESTEYFFS
jgi:hypothetical protein